MPVASAIIAKKMRDVVLTDKDFFESSVFAAYLRQLLTVPCAQNKVDIPEVKILNSGNSVAYTDGKTLYIIHNAPLFKSPNRLEKTMLLCGAMMHEVGHYLYTDFDALHAIQKSFAIITTEYAPDDLETEALAADFDLFLYGSEDENVNMNRAKAASKIWNEIFNILEDGYVEKVQYRTMHGILLDSLDSLRNRHYMDSYDSKTRTGWHKDGLDNISIALNALLEYSKFDELPSDWNEYSDDVATILRKVKPYVFHLTREDDRTTRMKEQVRVFLNLFPLFKAGISAHDDDPSMRDLIKTLKKWAERCSASSDSDETRSEDMRTQKKVVVIDSSEKDGVGGGLSKAPARARKKSVRDTVDSDESGPADTGTPDRDSESETDDSGAEETPGAGSESEKTKGCTDGSDTTESEKSGEESSDSDGDFEAPLADEDSEEFAAATDSKSEKADDPEKDASDSDADGTGEAGSCTGDAEAEESEGADTGDDADEESKDVSSEDDDADGTGEAGSCTGDAEAEESEGADTGDDADEESKDVSSEDDDAEESTEMAFGDAEDEDEESEDADDDLSSLEKDIAELEAAMKRIEKDAIEEKAIDEVESDAIDKMKEFASGVTYSSHLHKKTRTFVFREKEVPPSLIAEYSAYACNLEPIAKMTARKVAPILEKKCITDMPLSGCFTGSKFNASATVRGDMRYFTKNSSPHIDTRVAVSVLVDESGSMSGGRIYAAKKAALAVYLFCKELNIPCAVEGHTEPFGGRTTYLPARQRDLVMTSYADFDDIDGKDKYRILNITAKDNNRDGAALVYSGERLLQRSEPTKLLMVISDGAPAACDYTGVEAEMDMKYVLSNLTRRGAIVFALAIGGDKDAIYSIYGKDRFVNISDLNELPLQMVQLVKRFVR